jgi:peptide/nickel transport system substrate-binding protein
VWDEAYRAGRIAEAIAIDAEPSLVFGTGPYRLAVSEPGRIVLERNEHYWKADAAGTRLPYADDLMFLNAGDQNAWRLKFEARGVDQYLPRADEIASFKDAESAADFKLYDLGPRSGTTHLWFNQNPGRDEKGRPFVDPAKLAFFQDLRFRQAVVHAIDREAIVRTCYNGFGTVIDGPISPSTRFWFNERLPRYEHDVARAKTLLSEIALRDGDGDGLLETPGKKRLTFTIVTNSESPVRVAIGRLIVDDLRAVGLDAHLETMEIGALIARVQQTFRYEACLLALSGAVDPAVGLSVWHSSGEMHQFHPSQPAPATAWEREVDSLLTASVETVALDERKRLFDRVQELYAINLGWIFLANDNTFLAVRNRFGNVRPGTLRAMNEFCWNEDELFIK